jgi:hypothetical protein
MRHWVPWVHGARRGPPWDLGSRVWVLERPNRKLKMGRQRPDGIKEMHGARSFWSYFYGGLSQFCA